MNKLKKAFEKLVLKNPDNFTIIFFHGGMAGSSLLRILSAHEEFYHSFKTLNQLDYDDPIRYPDSLEGFLVHSKQILSFKEQHLACAHIEFHAPWDSDENILKYFDLVKRGKKIALKTHDFSLYEKFKKCTCIFIVVDKPLNRGIQIKYSTTSFSVPDGVFTVNMNNLLSKDYDIFLEEYLKIVFKFKLTPRINSVRSFILMWLERQERFKKTLS